MALAPTDNFDDASRRAPDPGTVRDARSDAGQRRIVDAAIAVQASSNTMSAVEYLRTRNIQAGVIARVLLEPARRRAAE